MPSLFGWGSEVERSNFCAHYKKMSLECFG